LLYIGSSTKSVQALLGGDIDIVYSAAGALVDTNLAGAELIIVGCQYDNGQTSFVKDYALRIPYVSVAGLTSILEFRAETAAEAKKTRPGKNVRQLVVARNSERNHKVREPHEARTLRSHAKARQPGAYLRRPV